MTNVGFSKMLATIALVAVVASTAAWLPSAEAHYCVSREGEPCDPAACKSGEDHYHRYEHGKMVTQCYSEAPPKPQCYVDEWEAPQIVCDVLPELPRNHLLLA